MNKQPLKSIGAILAGFVAVFIISMITDIIFIKSGLMKQPFSETPSSVIVLIIIYRNIYNVAGSYLVAALAPNRPLQHAFIVGILGFILSLIATIALWDKSTAWYSICI